MKPNADTIISRLVKYHKDRYSPMSGQDDPYKVLVSCIISQRTRDEQTERISAALFALADTPKGMLRLGRARVEKILSSAGFFRAKARHIIGASEMIVKRFGGKIPREVENLLELPGVGRKTANIVLVFGYGIPAIPVDTHVHRISNRLGLVATSTPEKTEAALTALLPKRLWLPLNSVMVRHGQTICRPISPLCGKCPVVKLCSYDRKPK